MGKNSSIEWTHHTFNPWWGCAKVSEACQHCYAEIWSKRTGNNIWGETAKRRFFGKRHWCAPISWNMSSEKFPERQRVFCASMADVFEDRTDLDLWRARLWKLIESTNNLDWLLLTKRPEKIAKMVPWKLFWPKNVWLGVTVENQVRAIERIPELIQHPVKIRFISCEPLLDFIDLSRWIQDLDWVIVGGESGPHARPMHPVWVRDIREQCTKSGVPFYFKQRGNWKPLFEDNSKPSKVMHLEDGDNSIVKVGYMSKKKAGRDFDGRIWNEVPTVRRHSDIKSIAT